MYTKFRETFFTKMYMGETFFIKMSIKLVWPRKHLKIKKMPHLLTYFIFFCDKSLY